MTHKKIAMEHDKKIALIAHDHKKRDLVEWAKFNRTLLAHHRIYATGNRASADFMISSPLMDGEYDRLVPDYETYRARKLDTNAEMQEILAEK